MAVNRLAQLDHAGLTADADPAEINAPSGFAAVPVSGIPGWEQIRPDAQALYDFAFLLAQMQDQNDPAAGSRWLEK